MIGIYRIRNLINGKVYIGQSWDMESRWSRHRNNEQNSHLKSAYGKYGIDNFEFTILREFHESGLTNSLLTIFEQKYMEEYDARNPKKGYNFKEAGPRGRHSEESKRKVGEKNKLWDHSLPEYRAKLSESHKGHAPSGPKQHSVESRQKMSETRKGKKFTEEHKQHLAAALCVAATKRDYSKIPHGPLSAETKQKIAEGHRIHWAEIRAQRVQESVATNLDSNSGGL
jgi:group I intron endonuclease